MNDRSLVKNIYFIKFYICTLISGYKVNFSVKELQQLVYTIINWYEEKYADIDLDNLNSQTISIIKKESYNNFLNTLSTKEINLLNNNYYSDINNDPKSIDYITIETNNHNNKCLLIFSNEGIISRNNLKPFVEYIGNFDNDFTLEKLYCASKHIKPKIIDFNKLESIIKEHEINKYFKLFILNIVYEYFVDCNLEKIGLIILNDFNLNPTNLEFTYCDNKLLTKRKKYQTH